MKLILASILVSMLSMHTVYGMPLTTYNQQLKVVDQFSEHDTEKFRWGYELSDGRTAEQNGFIKELEDGTQVLVITGSYSFTAPNGIKYTVNYQADENGYHPEVIVGEFKPPTVGLDPKVLISLVG